MILLSIFICVDFKITNWTLAVIKLMYYLYYVENELLYVVRHYTKRPTKKAKADTTNGENHVELN